MPKYILEISYDIDVQIKKTFNSFYLFNLTFKNIKENTQKHTFPASGGAWFTIRREKNQETGGDLDWLLPLFPSPPAVRNTVTCNNRKTQAVVLFYLFSQIWIFRVWFSIFLPLSGG
jgi:hypothetical protein